MKLHAYINDHQIGSLWENSDLGQLFFDYGSQWVNLADAYPISPHLEFSGYDSEKSSVHNAMVKVFFENMLPEGQGLDLVSTHYQVSKGNLIGLMAHLGEDLPGALRLRLEGTPPKKDVASRPISRQELSEKIRARKEVPFSVWDRKVRVSVAGFQDKIVAFERSGQWSFENNSRLASNVIIKPEPTNILMSGLTGNEFLCMKLASLAGLSVADVRLEHVPEPILAIKRFDRVTSPNFDSVQRLHVIDGCQALGIVSGAKYERLYGTTRDVRDIRDGASLPKIFSVVNNSNSIVAQRLELLRWVIFQVLIGNTDAHAKNISFFFGSSGLKLTPTYDLVCTPGFGIDNLEDEYAMSIGDAFTEREITPFEWAEFANLCDVPPALISRQITLLCDLVKSKLDGVKRLGKENHVNEKMTDSMCSYIGTMCDRQMSLAPQIKDVDKSLLSEKPKK